jgi:DNA-binding response OmpR family regulator
VLLVEDSTMITSALELLLEAGGFHVTVAATAAEASAWDGPDPPDVMLLDLGLPDADGLSVLDSLDARGMRPRATFAMTGHDDNVTRARCLERGCAGVLVKPVPVQQLLRIVSDAAA